MHALYPIQVLRTIEQAALAALPAGTLMERAGKASAELALSILSGRPEKVKNVLVFAGPGNNGGDALETAVLLSDAGINVSVLLLKNRANKEPKEASLARQKAIKSQVKWEDAISVGATIESIKRRKWSLAIDGMFGIGLKSALTGERRDLAAALNELACPVLALDVPSGLNADTGTVVGEDGIAVRATHTITFISDKPGLHTAEGRDYAGEVHVADLAVERKYFPGTDVSLNEPELFAKMLRPRLQATHKGTYGRIAVYGGADGMAGAPVLAARAALYLGSGLTYAVYMRDPPAYDPVTPELMFRAAHLFSAPSDVSVIGPGLGRSPAAEECLEKIIASQTPALFDADALNIIAEIPEFQRLVSIRQAPSVITPHPLEAARLLGTDSASVQADRVPAARELARRFKTVAVLKGSGTVIASPDGKTIINPTGNPGLATAGTGDVLSGMAGSLMAQGWPVWEAALAAVWLHGKAADRLEKEHGGCIGITAGEIAPAARLELNALIAERRI